jgi:trk system potassium uptake protein TrkA
MLRKMKVKRIIGRVINPIHQSILNELGIEEVIHPEEEIATELSAMLMLKDAVKTMFVNDKVIIAELKIPSAYVGHSLEAVNLKARFNIDVVAVKIAPPEKAVAALFRRDYQVDTSYDPGRLLGEKDRLIVIGTLEAIRRFVA